MCRAAGLRQVVAQGLRMNGGMDRTGHYKYSEQKLAGILTPPGVL
jgi:hypothetical protein